MPVATMEDILGVLRLQVHNDLALSPLCTRVMLRTGVDIRKARQDQQCDRKLVAKVVSTLSEMGYTL